MITGVDHIIYSGISPFTVYSRWIKFLNLIWKSPIIDEFEIIEDQRLEIFFAKDQEMYDKHDEVGYCKNKDDESCILLISSKKKRVILEIDVKEEYFNGKRNDTEVYHTELLMNELWMYTLVLPDLASECTFSKKIYDGLRDILTP